MIKRYLKKLMPSPLIILKERIKLRKACTLFCNVAVLADFGMTDFGAILNSKVSQRELTVIEERIALLLLPDEGGGVNPGDRRAIYHLVRHLKPRAVLEVGTHIGASTVYIATALKNLRSVEGETGCRLVTLDIRDVNNPISKPWLKYGSKYAPIEVLQKMECDDLVRFITSDSLDYFSKCEQKYDLIFLDGDHSASAVYREIPAAMRLLNQEGYILLHDYFPRLRPLWSNGEVVPGPYLATHRLEGEGANIRVFPLGRLPWPTKLHSNMTSLALLGRANPPTPYGTTAAIMAEVSILSGLV